MDSVSSSEEKHVEGIQEEDEAFSLAMTVVTGAVPTIVLQAAIELGLLEIIKKAGSGALMSASEIASELPNNRNKDAGVMLDRMLSLLASYSIISCSVRTTLPDGNVERLYGLAPPCKFLTKNEDGASLGVLFYTMKLLFETSAHFKDVVLDGGTAFEKTFGMTIFERMEREPSFNKLFNDVMSSSSNIIMRKIVDSYEGFKNLSSLVDVAGGTGATLNIIVSKYPKIKGINFDLSHVVKNAPSYPGVEHVGGDMFISIPHGEAILMKWNCHCWSDEECINFLKRCHAALPDHGKVIVCDYILPNEPNTSNSARTIFHFDVAMLAQTGGKERTKEQFEGLAKAAGFEDFRVACSAYNTSVMEFLKN